MNQKILGKLKIKKKNCQGKNFRKNGRERLGSNSFEALALTLFFIGFKFNFFYVLFLGEHAVTKTFTSNKQHVSKRKGYSNGT